MKKNMALFTGWPSLSLLTILRYCVLGLIWFYTIGFYISFLFQPKGMKSNYSTPISSCRSCQTAICKWEGFFPLPKVCKFNTRGKKDRGKNTNEEQKGPFNYLHSRKCYRCNHLDDWFHRSTFSVACLSSDTPHWWTFLVRKIRKSQIDAA